MTAIDVLYLATQDGIDISLNGDQLQLKLPENKDFDESLLQQIKDNKQSIIDYLSNNSWKSNDFSTQSNKINKFDRNTNTHIPLSFSQERIWFIDQLEGSMHYHAADVFKLIGKVNKNALESAIKTIVNRHEILRTVIVNNGDGTFQHLKEEDSWQLSAIDGSRYQDDKAGLLQYINKLIDEPFNLSKDDMIRVHVISLGEEEHRLILIMHHIASDGWSRAIFSKELAEIYDAIIQGRKANLNSLQLQYADYAVWQRQNLQGEFLNNKLRYWKQKLVGV